MGIREPGKNWKGEKFDCILYDSILYVKKNVRLAHPQFLHPLCPNNDGGEEPKLGEGPSRALNRMAISWPRIDGSGSAMEWRGVGDKLVKKGEKPAG
jgi:hypothetical protein